MSTITLPVLYRSETIGASFVQKSPEKGSVSPVSGAHAGAAPQRQAPFLAQLITGNDPDFQRKLGRADVARAREAAYQGMKTIARQAKSGGIGQTRIAIADLIA